MVLQALSIHRSYQIYIAAATGEINGNYNKSEKKKPEETNPPPNLQCWS